MAGLLSSRLYGIRDDEERGARRSGGLLSSRLGLSQQEEPKRREAPKPAEKVGPDGLTDYERQFLPDYWVEDESKPPSARDIENAKFRAAKAQKREERAREFEAEHPQLTQAMRTVDEKGYQGIQWVFKQLQRGRDFGTKLIDATATNYADAIAYEQGPIRKAVAFMTSGLRALGAAGREAVVQEEQISASDLLKRGMPQWTAENPKLAGLLGFAGDIAVDPTTYLTFGSSTAIRPAKVGIAVDQRALRNLTVEAGVNPSAIDRLAKVAGKNRQAERALAFESKKALERTYASQRARLVGEYQQQVREVVAKYGAPAAAADNPTAAVKMSQTAITDAQTALNAAEKRLTAFERMSKQRPVKSPTKIMEREKQRIVLQDEVTKAQDHLRRVSDPVEDLLTTRAEAKQAFSKEQAAFEEQQKLFGGRIPSGVAPKGPRMPQADPNLAKVADQVALNRQLGAPDRLGKVGPVEAGTRAARDARRAKLAEETSRIRVETERKLFELDEARKALDGKVFRSGDELQSELGKLLGGKPSVEVVWDGPYQRMARLLEDPKVQATVRDKGGVKFAGHTVISGDTLARAAEVTGFSRVKELRDKFRHFLNETAPAFRGRNTPIVQELRQPVKLPDGRTVALGEAYVEARKVYESLTDAADNLAFKDATERFFSLGKDSRQKLGRMMWELDDIASGKGAAAGMGQADRIKLAQERIRAAKLTPDEDAAFRAYDSTMKQVAAVEKELGLLEHVHEAYFARYFKPTTKSAKRDLKLAQERELLEMNRNLLASQVPGGKLGAAKERVFDSLEQAQAAGFDPVFDMVASYALRLTQHRRAVAREQFRQTLFHLFPDAKEIPLEKLADGTPVGGMKLVGVPKEIARDLRFMGEGMYPQDSYGLHNLWRKYDKVMSVWRRAATVVRPNFGVRQGVSNALQMSLVTGMKALDPRAMAEAFSLLAGKGKDMRVRTLLGEEVLGAQLMDEANRLGILRGVTLEGIGPGANPRYQDKLIRSLDNAAMARRLGGDNAAAQGFIQFVNGSFRYTDIPAVVENYSRLSGYINARRMGHAPEEAAKLVDKALFDYMHGLNAFETRWVRRVVPFYSYQRFALPFMAHVLAHTPGRVTNLAKTVDGFFKAWSSIHSDTELTDTERRVLPGWLLEQPSAFRGFNDQMKAVHNTFNNFTPLDVLNMLPVGDEGLTERSTSEYVRKVGMAQLAPWVKIPIELMMEKDTFTGRALEENGLRKLGPADKEVVARWIGTAAVATLAQDQKWAALAHAGGWATGELTPEFQTWALETLLGWEEGIDPDTGEKTVYVSPYRFHVATSVFPALNDALKMGRTDRSPLSKTMQTLFGIGTVELDLAEEQQKRFDEHDRAISDQEELLDEAEERELYMRAAEAQEELAKLLERIEAEEQAMGGEVRGAQY